MGGVLSVGIIGAGGIARSHMTAISELENIRVAGVGESDIEAARALVEQDKGVNKVWNCRP